MRISVVLGLVAAVISGSAVTAQQSYNSGQPFRTKIGHGEMLNNDFLGDRRRCCKSLTTKDSLRESMALDAVHEQAISRPLSHDELVQLQRVAQEAGVSADLGRQG